MTNLLKRSIILPAAALIAIAAPIAISQTTRPATNADRETVAAVRAANDAFFAALNAMFTGDVAPMEAVWSHGEDVTYLPPTGQILAGWPATLASWKAQAEMRFGGRVEPRDVRIVLASPTAAIVSGRGVGRNPNGPDGPINVNIRTTSVFRSEGDQWKLIHFHTDLLPQLVQETE